MEFDKTIKMIGLEMQKQEVCSKLTDEMKLEFKAAIRILRGVGFMERSPGGSKGDIKPVMFSEL